jgi:uncharacterized protein (DUF924 family)
MRVMEPAQVLGYWFADLDRLDDLLEERMAFWFRRGEDVDDEVRRDFGAAVEAAAAGGLRDWLETDRGWLAFIVLVDQFPRNIYRGSGQSFALDPLALATALDGLAQGRDRALPVSARPYIYLPLMHAEDRALQERSLELATELKAHATDATRAFLEIYAESAKEHYDIVGRFGRYPHRNQLLGRESTPDEQAFLLDSDFLKRV